MKKYILPLLVILILTGCGAQTTDNHSVPNDGAEVMEAGPTRLE